MQTGSCSSALKTENLELHQKSRSSLVRRFWTLLRRPELFKKASWLDFHLRTASFLKKEVTKTNFARTICVCKCNRFKSFMWAVILGQARIYISDPLAVFAVIERLAVRDPTALKLYSCRDMCDFHTTQFSWLSSIRLNCQDRSRWEVWLAKGNLTSSVHGDMAENLIRVKLINLFASVKPGWNLVSKRETK